MNKEKTKKLAIAAVAVVMAGSMVLPLAACGDTGNGGEAGYVPNTDKLETGYVPNFDAEGKLAYDDGITLRMNVGYQNDNNPARIEFNEKELKVGVTLPDGEAYASGDLKPAWAAASKELGIEFEEAFQNLDNEAQLNTPIQGGQMGNYDLITSSAAAMTQNTDALLNITPYLDYMPNYKHFLDSNPALYYSLTSDFGDSGNAMYYMPYFDGFNDIEKYALAEKTWLADLLSADDIALAAETTTFADQAKAKKAAGAGKASVESYMGKTGNWEVDATDPDDVSKLVKAKIDYDAALAAAKSTTGGLGAAINAAKGSAYTGESGNIVDIMNDVINTTNGAVTGGQLTKILQEYIDVAYTLDGAAYANRADVFNSVSAAWDVDLMVAAMRCVVASPSLVGESGGKLENLYGLAARQGTTQRRTDLTAMAGELYGIRGMESRYEYTYLDAEGEIQDARLSAETYELVDNFSDFTAEGLLYTGDGKEAAVQGNRDTSAGASPLFMHDYSQTQTTAGFDLTDKEDYNVAPIVTPVSKWDVDNDGTHETIMRFTESWRSVKNTGFCISKDGVQNNPQRLSAVLAFIDYLFSNDGQLVMTYGAQSTNGNEDPNGWWYADKATDVTLEDVAEQVSITTSDGQTNYSEQWAIKPEYETQYFVYKNEVYVSMVDYVRAIPKLTDDTLNLFLGEEINGFRLGNESQTNQSAGYSYTNFARYIMGATFPIGNKDQGFEYQCTAQCALDGAGIVSQALASGAIKHVTLSLADGQSMWYMIAPTSFALDSSQQSFLSGSQQTLISGTYFRNSSSGATSNVMLDMALYGLGSSGTYTNTSQNRHNTGAEVVAWLTSETVGLTERIDTLRSAWLQTAVAFGLVG